MNFFFSLVFHLFFHATLGIFVYASLALSGFDPPTKFFFGSAILLWAIYHDFLLFRVEEQSEHNLKVVLCSLEALEGQLADESNQKIVSALSDLRQRNHVNYLIGGGSLSIILILAIKYILWIVGGLTVAKYIT